MLSLIRHIVPLLALGLLQAFGSEAVLTWTARQVGPDIVTIINYPTGGENIEICTTLYVDYEVEATHCWAPRSTISDIDIWKGHTYSDGKWFEATLKQRQADGTIKLHHAVPVFLE